MNLLQLHLSARLTKFENFEGAASVSITDAVLLNIAFFNFTLPHSEKARSVKKGKKRVQLPELWLIAMVWTSH